MNIGIVIGSDETHRSRRAIAVDLALKWSNDVGGTVYEVELRKHPHLPIHFDKFRVMAEAMTAHDYVMWLDSDCCVVDSRFDLEMALHVWGTPATQMWIAQDWNGYCACMYVMRSCDWSRQFAEACMTVGFVREMGGQQDQGTIKQLACMSPTTQWRIAALPTTVVADQTLSPVPKPFVWHLSMGMDTLSMMRDVSNALANGTFEDYAKRWRGMEHGVRYE